jgi:hypothetical protein
MVLRAVHSSVRRTSVRHDANCHVRKGTYVATSGDSLLQIGQSTKVFRLVAGFLLDMKVKSMAWPVAIGCEGSRQSINCHAIIGAEGMAGRPMTEGFSKDQAIGLRHAGRSERSNRNRYFLRQGTDDWYADWQRARRQDGRDWGAHAVYNMRDMRNNRSMSWLEAFGGVVVQRRCGGRNHLLRAGHLAVDDGRPDDACIVCTFTATTSCCERVKRQQSSSF